ncbi:MAG: hypothetical protein DME26_05270 [Verrucomicrobia bacterium]|nr:MAG: hypothetical protein DME26_05270 [Verrucomicrobiota bacterium]
MPSEVTEGDAEQQATLRISAAPAKDVTVSLASSDPAQLRVPPTLRISAGQTVATFPVTVRQENDLLDGTQLVTVTARVRNWTDGRAVVTVRDNEPAVLELAIPAEASEGSGLLSGVGQIRLRGVAVTNLAVALSVSDTNKLIVPPTVIVPAGQSSAVFDLTIIDDTRFDGRVPVTITARAPGFSDGQATLVVVDNDVHHFVFGGIASPQMAGVPFTITLTAVDIATNRILAFTNAVILRVAGSPGQFALRGGDERPAHGGRRIDTHGKQHGV